MLGPHLLELSKRLRASVVRFAQPGQLFEDLGITYIGVVPGHDLRALIETLGAALALPGPDDRPRADPEGPRLPPAEADQVGFHGAALPPMTLTPARSTGAPAQPPGARSTSATTSARPPCRPRRWPTDAAAPIRSRRPSRSTRITRPCSRPS